MIKAHNLSKRFGDFLAVDQANFEVRAGEVMVLLGPNGAGKTTTVRMLTSIIKPSAGNATIAGFSIIDQQAEVRSRVGVLTEHHGLYKRMNAEEYLDFFGQLYRIPSTIISKRRDELLHQFGLYDVKRKRLGEYSKGMRQKLALSRALIHEPPVLLLDEPTSAMDKLSEAAPDWTYQNTNNSIQLESSTLYELKFSVPHSETDAPFLLKSLINDGLQVKEFSQIQRSLEQAYLEVVRDGFTTDTE